MPRWDEQVIVRSLKEDLPAKDPGIWQYLATNFIGSFETEAFSTLITAHYGYWLPRLEKGLIAKAKRESLDAESLQLCLVAVSNRLDREKLQYIPVAAYSTRQGGVPVWIIAVKWEQVHYQVFALDARRRNVIGFATCN